MTEYKSILLEKLDRVGLVRLNRLDKKNALDSAMLDEIMDALKKYDQDHDIGAIVIAGSDRFFSIGADINEMANATAQEMVTQDKISKFDKIGEISKPIIAAVNGWCLGGGFEVAMSCDMIVAGENAIFGQPEINLGIIPGAGGTQRLTKAVGKAIAMEVILNDRKIKADEALCLGLVNRVVANDQSIPEAVKLAQQIAARAPLAVLSAKRAVNFAFESSLSAGIAEERRIFYQIFDTVDQKEGMQAYLEKRTPNWKGK